MKKRAWRNLMLIEPDSQLMDNLPTSDTYTLSAPVKTTTVAPSTDVTNPPVIPITYIDPAISNTINELYNRTNGDIPALIDPNSYEIVMPDTTGTTGTTGTITKPTDKILTPIKETATNVVNDIANNIKDVFGGSDQSNEDNTGLYLAGAVVVIGLFALLFKK